MDSSKEAPFPPAGEVALHRNAPLAPSQELAYRKKCVQLRRRLAEIEANNDATRKRIAQESEHIQKVRLLRAILLNHLQEIMTTPAKKLTEEQLEKIGILANGKGHEAELAGSAIVQELMRARPDGEGLLDDSSDESEDEEPEPQERPERRSRKINQAFRETIMNTNLPGESSIAPQDPAPLQSSFRVGNPTPGAATPVPQSYPAGDSQYAQSSPTSTARHGNPYQSPSHGRSNPAETNGVARAVPSTRPERPEPPFVQFTAHMRPQLEADNYDPDQIAPRIQSEWDHLSPENRKLWDDRYEDQMRQYTLDMDAWKRANRDRRDPAGSSFAPVNS